MNKYGVRGLNFDPCILQCIVPINWLMKMHKENFNHKLVTSESLFTSSRALPIMQISIKYKQKLYSQLDINPNNVLN